MKPNYQDLEEYKTLLRFGRFVDQYNCLNPQLSIYTNSIHLDM